MPDCAIPPAGAPVLRLTLVGRGEPLLRLEKRLRCAAGAVGVALTLEIRKDPEVLGISYEDTPALFQDGRKVMSGLLRTEALEDWLRSLARTGLP